MKVLSALLVLLDSSCALLAPPVSSATRGLRTAVQAPCRSRCTLSQQGEEPQQLLGRRAFTRAASALLIALPFSAPSLAAADDCSYAALATLRSMWDVLVVLQLAIPAPGTQGYGPGLLWAPPKSASAAQTPEAARGAAAKPEPTSLSLRLSTTRLPAALTKVNNLATGDPKVAQAGLQAEPLLAKEASLSAALDACSEDDKTKKETLKKYTLMRDELSYQAGKLYDARWADPDDTADLQTSIKKAKAAIENFLASVPAEKRAPPAAT